MIRKENFGRGKMPGKTQIENISHLASAVLNRAFIRSTRYSRNCQFCRCQKKVLTVNANKIILKIISKFPIEQKFSLTK